MAEVGARGHHWEITVPQEDKWRVHVNVHNTSCVRLGIRLLEPVPEEAGDAVTGCGGSQLGMGHC